MPGWIHDLVVGRIATLAAGLGATVHLERPIRVKGRLLFADLTLEHGSNTILVEVERSADRVAADVEKAIALPANLLVIVTPDAPTALAIRRALRRQQPAAHGRSTRIVVAPYAIALEALTQFLTIDDFLVGPMVNSSKNGCTASGRRGDPSALENQHDSE